MLSRNICSAVAKSVTKKASFIAAFTMTIAAVQISRSDDTLAQEAEEQVATTSDVVAQDETPTQTHKELGVLLHESRAFPGYNLITTSDSASYLFDNEGRVVHCWTSETDIGHAYLLDNGHLFRMGLAAIDKPFFRHPALTGRFQEFDWHGNRVWDFEYHSEKRLPHHDAIKLPNGNVLMICWEMITAEEAIAQGRRPETVKDSHLQPDCLVEVRPTGQKTGEVVWEWRSWDHLIQDYDRTRPNFGKIADHPERFNVNYTRFGESALNPDWMHVNAVAYNADLDQIALSSPSFSEIWIIDHSTTTEEARGHTGGRRGKGGDILYRWGNPSAYDSGTKIDQRLFFQHNIHWITKGLPGEGHLLVFNNGPSREPVQHSSVDEFEPPINDAGDYIRREHATFGPDAPLWSYTAPNKSDFFSWFISGAQRLPNGNTLINAGAIGVVFEVTPEQEIVWKFVNPISNEQSAAKAAPPPFQVISDEGRGGLGINEEQRKQLDELGNELNAKLDEVLTADQKRILTGPDDVDMSTVPAGEYFWSFKNDKLKLTEAQTTTLQTMAKELNPKIATILTEEQRHTLKRYKEEQGRNKPRRQLRPRNTLFRAMRFGLDHPAFTGKTLIPGKTLVELQEERQHAENAPK